MAVYKVKRKEGTKLDYVESAAGVVSQAIGENLFDGSALPSAPEKSVYFERGRKGGLKGGKARAEKLTAKKRSQIAKKAAKSRWK